MMDIKSDYWGNLTIHIHIDQLIGLLMLIVIVSVTLTAALTYDKGFIQWFKDKL